MRRRLLANKIEEDMKTLFIDRKSAGTNTSYMRFWNPSDFTGFTDLKDFCNKYTILRSARDLDNLSLAQGFSAQVLPTKGNNNYLLANAFGATSSGSTFCIEFHPNGTYAWGYIEDGTWHSYTPSNGG